VFGCISRAYESFRIWFCTVLRFSMWVGDGRSLPNEVLISASVWQKAQASLSVMVTLSASYGEFCMLNDAAKAKWNIMNMLEDY